METQNEHNYPNSPESKIVYAGQTKILIIKVKNNRSTCGFTKSTQLKKIVDFHTKERILIVVQRKTTKGNGHA
jgi:hypothetical protein